MHSSLQASSTTVISALTLALQYKYMEQAFYTRGYATFNMTSGTSSDKFTAAEDGAVSLLRAHETAHVAVLAAAIGAGAPPAPAASSYDWTGGSGAGNGPFDQSMTTRSEFFKVAQLLEDTGVRALKGQLANLFGAPELTPFVQMHSTEGRHAAMVRMFRTTTGMPFTSYPQGSSIPPWPTSGTSIGPLVGNSFTTVRADSGKTQREIATLAYGPAGTPPPTYGAPPGKSVGEDNVIESSSFKTDAWVVNKSYPYALDIAYAYAFDEPMDSVRTLEFAAYFGVTAG